MMEALDDGPWHECVFCGAMVWGPLDYDDDGTAYEVCCDECAEAMRDDDDGEA